MPLLLLLLLHCCYCLLCSSPINLLLRACSTGLYRSCCTSAWVLLLLPPRSFGSYRSITALLLYHYYSWPRLPPSAGFVTPLNPGSNFGNAASPGLLPCLESLLARGLVDELVCVEPRTFTKTEKRSLVSPRATGLDLGGARHDEIDDAFFNEMTKREVGRRRCLAERCTHFMAMDTDECYLSDELAAAKKCMVEGKYEALLCRMRYFFKSPEYELLPHDDMNWVAVMYSLSPTMPFRLGCPYPCLLDPTRRLHNVRRLKTMERSQLQMYHYSFVRADNCVTKLLNVSNRVNYDGCKEGIDDFVKNWSTFEPPGRAPHPHPYFRTSFTDSQRVENWFGITV